VHIIEIWISKQFYTLMYFSKLENVYFVESKIITSIDVMETSINKSENITYNVCHWNLNSNCVCFSNLFVFWNPETNVNWQVVGKITTIYNNFMYQKKRVTIITKLNIFWANTVSNIYDNIQIFIRSPTRVILCCLIVFLQFITII
jgi:hypothetical protein